MKQKPVIVLLICCLLVSVAAKVSADGTILVFHRFNDGQHPSTSISTEKLTELFVYLKKNDYQVISLEKLISYLRQKQKVPDKTVVLTIDDGYESFYQHGLEIFKEYQYPFTIFIATKPINQGYGDFLSWEQLQEIKKYGTIASHSYAHHHLTALPAQQIEENIKQSINHLQTELDVQPQFFSYPYGEYNQQVVEIVNKLGFEAALTQDLGAVAQGSSQLKLARAAVTNNSNFQERLGYQHLPAIWLAEEKMVVDNRLVRVKVQTKPEIKQAQLYITGHGWQKVELDQGELDLELDLKLLQRRNRIFLKSYQNEITSKLILRQETN